MLPTPVVIVTCGIVNRKSRIGENHRLPCLSCLVTAAQSVLTTCYLPPVTYRLFSPHSSTAQGLAEDIKVKSQKASFSSCTVYYREHGAIGLPTSVVGGGGQL